MVVRHNLHKNVRILLVGDRGVGKTSLILSLVSEEFPEDVPAKSEEITIPADVTPELVPTNIVDSSAIEQTNAQLVEEIQRANVICIVYSVEDDDSMDRVTTHWIPFIRSALSRRDKCPIVLVGNKTDLVDYSTVDAALDVMNDYKEVESFVECSAKSLNNVSEIFYYAQKAVLHPTGPLYISETQDLTEPCKKALKRIFKICDTDNDGLLNDAELNAFQKRCFDTSLQRGSVEDIKALLQRNISGGLSGNYFVTLTGFLYLHCLFLQRGRSHTTWAVLRQFGYNDSLCMDETYLYPRLAIPAGSTTELSYKGQQYLASLFCRFDKDRDGALSPSEQHNLFSTCPQPAWGDSISRMVETNSQGYVTLHGFLCFWVLKTLNNPRMTLEYLAYFGYPITETENQTSAIVVTREKSLDLLKKQSTRSVYECHVFGAKGVGKTSICQAFLGHTVEVSSGYVSGLLDGCTVNTVHVYGQEAYLVLKDMNVMDVANSLLNNDTSCDVACLVYDCTNPNSFRYITNLYKRYYADNKVPVLIVANKTARTGGGGDVEQHYKVQPIEFCDNKCLPPPHYFVTHSARQSELFLKLGTMAAFPNFKVMSLQWADPYMWKGLGCLTLFAALGFLVVKCISCSKRGVK